jgi:bifunctional DNA-binding transcriptional regulator/antitoxin component of YhaV-PrlF toxin-antitoxin module
MVLTNILYCCIFGIVMTSTIAITNRGQMHIPISFRKVLGLSVPGIVKIEIVGERMTIAPIKSRVLEMAGKYSSRVKDKKVNVERIRDLIEYSNA